MKKLFSKIDEATWAYLKIIGFSIVIITILILIKRV
jgi:hypothetical protein